MRNKKAFLSVVFLFLFLCTVYADNEIVVRADREELYNYNFDPEKIAQAKASCVADLISSLSGFNIISRGFPIIQSDIFSNAGTFEQVSIIVDGIKVNDSQTGHYSLDMPLSLIDIDEINVLNGANVSYGDGGFTGLVDITTKKYSKDTVSVTGTYGSYNTYDTAINAAKWLGDTTVSGTFEKSSSDGYHKDTDYNFLTARLKASFKDDFIADLGYNDKDYGAYDFYTPGLNLASREQIYTKYMNLRFFDSQALSFDSYLRSHDDKFTLDETNPDQNNVTNESMYGADAKYLYSLNKDYNLNFKYNLQREEVQSSVLGNHYRDKNLFLVNGLFNPDDDLSIDANASLEKYDIYSNFDFLPEISATYSVESVLKISAGSSYTVRYPNFTELYYKDIYDLGNPALKPERSYEERLGVDCMLGILSLKNSFFYRFNHDAIDWAAGQVIGPDSITRNGWIVENIGWINTFGYTLDSAVDLGNIKFSAAYTFLDSTESESYSSKYGTGDLKDKLVLGTDFSLAGIDIDLKYIYKKYINRDDLYNNFDCTVSKKVLDWLELSVKVEDIMNSYYEEIPGIPAMGRNITARAGINF